MCLDIDDNVKSLNKRTVWKIFDQSGLDCGPIVSLYQGAVYPKGKLTERSPGRAREGNFGLHGLHFYLSKSAAKRHAACWHSAYIAKFSVDPKDFMFASKCGEEAMYERATRVGGYIRVKND
jgi:hypothetical protein